MSEKTTTPAWKCMDDQHTNYGAGAAPISLSGIWRKLGKPAGKDPVTWALLAMPLIEGLVAYYNMLDVKFPPSGMRPHPTKAVDLSNDLFVWDLGWCGESDDCRRVGDLVATYRIAEFYADFLDSDRSPIGLVD